MENNQTFTLKGENTYEFQVPSLKEPQMRLKFVQWNLLAEWAATEQSFPKVDPSLFPLDVRWPKIVGLVRYMDADIYCFEECDFIGKFKQEFGKEFHLSFYSKLAGSDGGVIMWKKSLSEQGVRLEISSQTRFVGEDGKDQS
jgi:mRNA deadenylase 3'-5' endonuclease subunit Ccr4